MPGRSGQVRQNNTLPPPTAIMMIISAPVSLLMPWAPDCLLAQYITTVQLMISRKPAMSVFTISPIMAVGQQFQPPKNYMI